MNLTNLKILVINNYGQFCHLIHRAMRDFGAKSSLVSNELRVGDILKKEPDGLVLSGGPSLERIGNCMEYVHKLDLPILGICLGHQLMAHTFGGEVRKGKYGEYAEVTVEILDENDIFKGFPSAIKTWASHADEVNVLPEDFTLLARSDVCEVEAMKHIKKPLYGVQWHPEVSHTEHGVDLLKNFLKLCREFHH
ncbi:MAG: GMP synthase subunit A [Methanosarcinales archaeon]|nr:MAG: GMP synthase subunit A [Methanosarcinales archaeon]